MLRVLPLSALLVTTLTMAYAQQPPTPPPEYEIYHKCSTIGSWFLITAVLLMFGNLVSALLKGRQAPVDPWRGATLEWRTATPPPVLNFDGEPELSRGAYEYPVEVDDG